MLTAIFCRLISLKNKLKEYKFQYTKLWTSVIVVLLAILTFILSEFLGLYLKLNLALTIVLSFGIAFLFFKTFKRKVVHTCSAKLYDASIKFEFENSIKTIKFNELNAYKSYNGKNGPILYLKSNNENFKIFADYNYCNTDDFNTFCNDTIIKLDKYRDENNSIIVHEGSIYTTKGMLYFLILTTSIYFLAFFLETKALKIAIGISGGFFFFIMWTKYIIENNKSRD